LHPRSHSRRFWRRRRARTAVVHSVAGAVRNAIWRAGGLEPSMPCRRCSPRQCRSAPSVRSSEPWSNWLRVLMLGPGRGAVVAVPVKVRCFRPARGRSALSCSWFIIGFLVLATARSLGLIPNRAGADHDLGKSADGDIDGRTGTWRRSARRRPRRRPRHGRGGGSLLVLIAISIALDPAAPHRLMAPLLY